MSESTGQEGRPSVDITVSVDGPKDQMRDQLIKAIDAELERQETDEMSSIDVHGKVDAHLKS
jgi:hypothetical protein